MLALQFDTRTRWMFVVGNCFFLCVSLFAHSHRRYITFDAVKLESICHCTRIYFVVLFFPQGAHSISFYQWMSVEKPASHTNRMHVITSLFLLWIAESLVLNAKVRHETTFHFKWSYYWGEIIVWLWGNLWNFISDIPCKRAQSFKTKGIRCLVGTLENLKSF